MPEPVVIGLDIGTSGVRAVAVDCASGRMAAGATAAIPASTEPEYGWAEQRPDDWWRASAACLQQVVTDLAGAEVVGVCVDSTSGTVVLVDDSGDPVRDALMYNDARADLEADELNDTGADLAERMGYRFGSSYGLAKILWLVRHEPGACARGRFVNAADFIVGRLSGDCGQTDYTNALKMGFDLLEDRWPAWLGDLGIDAARMPVVYRTGDVIGKVSALGSQATGLKAGTRIAAGPTDGVAGFYASGAVHPGEASSTLGTTLVIKSVSGEILRDPLGRVYCHKHAEGHWLPGGASNCGCGYATAWFPDADLNALAREAVESLPCSLLLYPLPRAGERFPVVGSHIERLMIGEPEDEAEHFAAYLQGMAFVERWAYDVLAELGGETDGAVFSSGGGSHSDLWMQLRADVLGREMVRPAVPESVFGSAVLAASHTFYDSVGEAVAAMVGRERVFEPRDPWNRRLGILYERFRAECADEGMA